MAQNQTLVPDLSWKTLLIVAAIVVATIGLLQRRTKFTLQDGSIITGEVIEETADAKVVRRASGYEMRIPRSDIQDEEWFNIEFDLNLGLDLKGGTALRYRINVEDFPEEQRADIIERTVDTYHERLDGLGVKELSIRAAGEDEISIELPGVSMEESQAYENVVTRLGRLEFRIVAVDKPGVVNVEEEADQLRQHLQEREEQEGGWTPKGIDLTQFDVVDPTTGVVYRWFPYSEKTLAEEPAKVAFPFVMLELDDESLITGQDIEETFPSTDDEGRPALGFTMKPSRAADFGDFTEEHKGRYMAIVLDGEVSTAPVLNSRIERQGIIEGGGKGFTSNEVKELRTVLSSGSLRVKPEKLSKATIGPTLGEASIRRGVQAGIAASIVVVVFMLGYYLGVGVISCLTLLIGMYLLVGGLAFIGATLTLPGIAGILLTVGMAVDQNILINERIREERAKGKTIAQSIKNGFERAFVTIVDAQVTTFIAGFVLYKFGTGPVKGFAVTLMLGILTTMFAALTGSKVLFAWGLARDWFRQLRMRQLFGETNIEFIRYLKPCLTASTLMIAGGLALFAYDYRNLQGLDFAGGFQAQVSLKEPHRQAEVFETLRPRFESVQVVSLIDEQTGRNSDEEGTRQFRITIRAEEGDPQESRDFRRELVEALGPWMLPEPVAELMVEDRDGRASASFVVNFSQPVPAQLVEGRLRRQMAVQSVEPVAGAEPADSYRIQATYPHAAPAEQVEAEVVAALMGLPAGARLSDPVPASQFIGGRVGKQLTNSAIQAIIVAIIFILIYIRIRFHDFTWGLAACVATLHDVLFGIGAVALVHFTGLVNIELDLTMIGAFLTIVGYSLNDTIVIFDRIRENLPRVNRPLSEVVNLSINQTLSRTVLTAVTTLIAVAILFIWNYGQRNVLEGFAFVLGVGLIVGTYSTVYIATPLLVWLIERKQKKTGKPVSYAGAGAR